MSLDIEGLRTASRAKGQSYRPLSKYPSVLQDISLKVPSSVTFSSLRRAIDNTVSGALLQVDVTPVAVYQPEHDTATKTMTFRIRVTSFERTLREEEVTALVTLIADAAKQKLGAELV